jgi:hypothetical protein
MKIIVENIYMAIVVGLVIVFLAKTGIIGANDPPAVLAVCKNCPAVETL